jgi:hypothetical protein
MDAIPAFSDSLPRIWEVTLNLKDELENRVFREWDSLYQRLDFLAEQEWIDAVDSVIYGWKKIATQEAGITAKHTLIVLACCMNLSEYQQASSQTRREIEWAALFHDLDKDVLYGRGDGAHGVRSAAAAAQCLVDLGFDFRSDGDIVVWLDLVKSAQKQVDGKWVNDFSHLLAILTGLRNFFGVDTPAERIIKAVMFHQAMPTVGDWPNPVILNNDEIRASLTQSDMDVLGPLMLGDSDAWNVCEPMRDDYMDELRWNIAKVRKVIE